MAKYWLLMVAALEMTCGGVLVLTGRTLEAIFLAVIALCFVVFQCVKTIDEWIDGFGSYYD